MANATGWGGKREGGGRPSKFSIEQKKTAAAKKKQAVQKLFDDAEEDAAKALLAKVKEGHWEAIKFYAEKQWGRPTARQEAADTDFVLKLAFDRKAAPAEDADAPE